MTDKPLIPLAPQDQAKCDKICELIAEGKSLNKICKEDGLPKKSTFLFWVAKYPELADQYARARDIGMDVLIDEISDLADAAAEKPTADKVQAARLQIDTRKWQAGKQMPKKYGDSLRHDGEITLSISDKLKKARERANSGS